MLNWHISLLSLAMVAVNSLPASAFSVGGNNNSRQHRRSKSQTAKILTSTYTLASGIIGSSSSSASSLRYMDERDEYCTTSNITDDWSLRLPTTDQELQAQAQDDIISHDLDSNSREPHEVVASTLPAAVKSVHWANRLDTRFEHKMKSPQDLAETIDSVATSVQAVSSSAAPHAVQAAHQPIMEAAKAFVPVAIEIGTVILSANHIPLN